jgi:hypothetical protein
MKRIEAAAPPILLAASLPLGLLSHFPYVSLLCVESPSLLGCAVGHARNHVDQNMARNAGQERMAIAFQTVSMVSMALVGVAATIQLLHEMRRSERGRERG